MNPVVYEVYGKWVDKLPFSCIVNGKWGFLYMTPGDLVRTVAAALDVPLSVVVQHDRRLAEEGFRTKGGRGSSSPTATAEDAAKLITAVLSGERYSETFENVRQLWGAQIRSTWSARHLGLVAVPKVVTDKEKEDEAIKAFGFKTDIENALGNFAAVTKDANGTFGECITALVNDAVGGQLKSFVGDDQREARRRFQIKVVQPSVEARIGFSNGKGLYLEYEFMIVSDSPGVLSEIMTTREVTAIPLVRIAEAFRI